MAKHILSARQFDRTELLDIFQSADELDTLSDQGFSDVLAYSKRGMISLFFEPSSRTDFSFQLALQQLGGKLLFSTSDPQFSSTSMKKGESLEQTIANFSCYKGAGVIVLRHPDNGAAERAAKIADKFGVSVINAGDGKNEHPTQALLDLYTIWKRCGRRLQDANVALCNDLESSRTIRSLAILISRNFPIRRLITCAPAGVSLPPEIIREIKEKGIILESFQDLTKAARYADFLYMTRPQKERYSNPEKLKIFNDFRVTEDFLNQKQRSTGTQAWLMHPGPIDDTDFQEVEFSACFHPRSLIYEQAGNGLYIRMALLKMLLGS